MPRLPILATSLTISLVLAVPVTAGETDDMIADALSAAPPQVAATAEVRDFDGNVLREGDGSYTCFPSPPDFAGPMCMDATFLGWLDAMMNGEEPQIATVGLSYMLAGDSAAGGASNIDPAARTPSADNDWVVEGPHIMMIVPDAAMLEGLPTTPVEDGPYVMWAGTPYAHIMMPVDDRPEQRPVE